MKRDMKAIEKWTNGGVYAFLICLSVLWLIPIIWIVLTSLRQEKGSFVPNFVPKKFTLANYISLFTETNFLKWFGNTFFVACFSCILVTIISLGTAYVISRIRFKMRKSLMNIALILGMFPSFMSMIAVYYVIKGMGLAQSLAALIMVYSAGAGLQFYIAKGFFDTIPKSLDEAAKLDGATNAQIFWKIILPLSKPILIYTALTAFMAPWMDFIFAKVIMGTKTENFTVAIGLFEMLDKEHIYTQFTQFAAGSVCIAIPITVLFIFLQKFYVEGITSGSVKG